MIDIQFKVKFVKSKGAVKFVDPTGNLGPQAAAAGKAAFRMIRDRIVRQGVDADGKALPPLHVRPPGDSIYNLAFDDPKYQEFLAKLPKGLKEYYSNPDRPKRPKKPAHSAYAKLKARAGRSEKRDGLLTGAMWNSPLISLTNLRGRNLVKITFTGRGASTPARGKKPAIKGAMNRDKARLLQYVKRDKNGGVPYGTEPDFVLMALTARELGIIRDDILASISVFGPASAT